MATLPLLMALFAALQTYTVQSGRCAVAPANLPQHQESMSGLTPDEVTLDLDVPAGDYSSNPALRQKLPYAELDVGDISIPVNGAPPPQAANAPKGQDCP